MTSVTPTSESASPTVPNVLAERPPVIPGESATPTEKREIWRDQEPKGYVYPIPRKSCLNAAETLSDMHAPLGFEPEGRSCAGTSSFSGGSSGDVSPNCLKWAESWQALLYDPVGLKLFQQFLKQEDPVRLRMLNFWLACRGLSVQDPRKAHTLIRVIHGKLCLKGGLEIGENLKKTITQRIKEDTLNHRLLSPSIFDEARKEVERIMSEVMHPNFLSSDIYLNSIQKMRDDSCNIDTSCDIPETSREAPALLEEQYDDELPEIFSQPLPVVDEYAELSCSMSSSSDYYYPSRRRNTFWRTPPESCLSKYSVPYSGSNRTNSRRLYNCSYNPVSRQDSELQSLSSDARTDSMSDLNFDDIASSRETYAQKRQLQRQFREMKDKASVNRNFDTGFIHVPRTANPEMKEKTKPLDPQVFAKNLISKLVQVQKEREQEEKVIQKLNSIDVELAAEGAAHQASHQAFNDDDCQEILDNHVSRVWSDKTPRRSPSIGTPVRPKSPDGRKGWPPHAPPIKAHPSAAMGRVPHTHGNSLKKKEKDLCSLFSYDSGNGTDPTEGLDYRYRSLAKSKSMPEQAEQARMSNFPGYCQRGASKGWSNSRRSLTDSGVSMVSGGHVENIVAPPSPQYKEKFVSSWLTETDRVSCNLGYGATCSVISEEKESVVSSSSKHKAKSNASSYTHSSRSKAGMPDRGMGSSSVKNILPGQPFVADPSMPPFPFHSVDTDTQLEETIRRLNEMGHTLNRTPASVSASSKSCEYENSFSGVYPQTSPKTEIPPQRPTTLTRSSYKPASEESSFTTVLIQFNGDAMPFLIKVPGSPIKLKQMKEYMHKKGRYRYFFVTPCADLENKPIQEEITDDNQVLPLWKGRVRAHAFPVQD